jgi:hypothetical protein
MEDKIRKNLHLEILKYAHEQIEFTYQDMFDDLNFNQTEKNLFCDNLMHGNLLIQNTCKEVPVKIGQGKTNLWTISTEGRFKLLDYQQLYWAKFLSIAAIIISLIVAITTTVIQLKRPMTINTKQFKSFIDIGEELKTTNTKINSLSDNQLTVIEELKKITNQLVRTNR